MRPRHPPNSNPAPAPAPVIRLASRGSQLARIQTGLAATALADTAGLATELVVITSVGDARSATPVSELPGQGWFTGEVEEAIISGRADIAVHSAKDLPSRLATGLAIVALLPRADPRDALVSRTGVSLARLPPGATVATSSPRRRALLQCLRPELRVVAIRGNVDTRIRRLDGGEFDGLVLACAGLDRLGLGDRIAERLDPEEFVPAPAQGAIALEAVAGGRVAELAAMAAHPPTARAVAAERAVLAGLGGGCLLPLGVWATADGESLTVIGALAVDGGLRRARLTGAAADAERLGAALAELLCG